MQRRRLYAVFLPAGIIVLGLAVRFALAPSPGLEYDVSTNQGWGKSAVELGLAQSYVEQIDGNMLPNYAPFSIMIFASAAYVQKWFFGGFDDAPLSYLILIKLPAILADVLTALLFYFIIGRWKGWRAGSIAGMIYALHPAVIHNSAFWGQTDSIFTFFLVAGAATFVARHYVIAGAFAALALLSKMQAVALMPLFLLLFLQGGRRAFWEGLLGGVLLAAPILMPFLLGGTLDDVLRVYVHSVGYYPIVSSAAYNFWWALFADEAGNIQDTVALLGPLTYRHVGMLLFGSSILYVLAVLRPYLRPTPDSYRTLPGIFLAGAYMSLAFFLFNTQMHERYLFPFVAFGLPMAFIDRKGAILYALVSINFTMNLYGWLHATTFDRRLFELFPAFDVLIASLQVFLFLQFTRYILVYRKTHAVTSAVPTPAASRSDSLWLSWEKKLA